MMVILCILAVFNGALACASSNKVWWLNMVAAGVVSACAINLL